MGASIQYGQIYNQMLQRNGDRSAYAVHLDYKDEEWGVQLEAGSYDYSAASNPVTSKDRILFGAYDTSFYVANKADFLLFNISKSIIKDTEKMILGTLDCYNNFALIQPKEVSEQVGDSTQQNTIGCSTTRGPLVTYVELISGKNSSFVNGPGIGLVDDNGWSSRLNVNIGYYF
ncbi:hypothetical protein [Shewanella frigidimarina]|uniref:Uncharacterized protein n=1 Tax=Shewanella frigidimarina TaxID=56812 RepID=A0A106BY90_SHEFR|nr:hypothetical protein [Shewanella frigidimarina]KVX00809.1 hypothetical protein AWJ07_19460 [Shewanella frigidimarina]